jgi:predicted nucleic acid binding AN1-type Zn finger protein
MEEKNSSKIIIIIIIIIIQKIQNFSVEDTLQLGRRAEIKTEKNTV